MSLLLSALLSTLVIAAPVLLFFYLRKRLGRNNVAVEVERAIAARLEKRFPAHDVRYVLDSLQRRDFANPDVLDVILNRVESLQIPIGREAKPTGQPRLAVLEDQIEVLKEQVKRLDRSKFDLIDLLFYTAAILAFLAGAASIILIIQNAL